MTAQHYRAIYRQSTAHPSGGQTCRVCGEWRPWDEYHRDSSYRTGRDSRCKSCRREATRAQPSGYAANVTPCRRDPRYGIQWPRPQAAAGED